MAITRSDRVPDTGTTPDRRVSRTQRLLKKALTELVFERPYESITVQEVIDRADVGRSTFYAHYLDKDDLLMAVFADLEVAPPDPSTWHRDDPPFAWSLRLFQHLEQGKRILAAVTRTRGGRVARDETTRWLRSLVDTELARLGAGRRRRVGDIARAAGDAGLAGRWVVGAFATVIAWWVEPDNAGRTPEEVDAAFHALVVPGLREYLGLQSTA